MNNINEHENIITEAHKERHDIKKYNFRNMEIANKMESLAAQKIESQTNETPQQSTTQVVEETPKYTEPTIDAPALKLFETEVIDKILQKSDVLAQSLQKLQEQFDKQEREISEKVNIARSEAKEQGINEGYQKAKQELEVQINSQRELYALSIQRIDNQMEQSKIIF